MRFQQQEKWIYIYTVIHSIHGIFPDIDHKYQPKVDIPYMDGMGN